MKSRYTNSCRVQGFDLLVGRRNALKRSGTETVQSTDTKRPYVLSAKIVAEVVTRTSAGNYALGRAQENGNGFCVLYVGRSDGDLARELHGWVGENARYKAFIFSYARDPKTAFEKECEDFHDFGGTERLDNAGHPQRPTETDWLCPRCDCFD